MKYTFQIDFDKDNTSVLILCDGVDIRALGYKRAENLENKDSLRDIIRNNKALLLIEHGHELEPLEIDFDKNWEETFENHISFDDKENCSGSWNCDYVFFVEAYERATNDLIVIFYLH